MSPWLNSSSTKITTFVRLKRDLHLWGARQTLVNLDSSEIAISVHQAWRKSSCDFSLYFISGHCHGQVTEIPQSGEFGPWLTCLPAGLPYLPWTNLAFSKIFPFLSDSTLQSCVCRHPARRRVLLTSLSSLSVWDLWQLSFAWSRCLYFGRPPCLPCDKCFADSAAGALPNLMSPPSDATWV